jgi:hypothetical protein
MDPTIYEVTGSSSSDLIRAAERCMDEVFPEYAPANLLRRLTLYGDAGAERYIQIYVIRDGKRVISFAQLFYKVRGFVPYGDHPCPM